MKQYPLLDTIDGLDQFRNIPEERLPELAAELRDFMVECVSKTGGHLASSLGAVELIMALHRVFSQPDDQIVFDVGHQTYAHKILTGRKEAFSRLRQSDGISGFPKRNESKLDAFDVGHSSTSISAALGLSRARKLSGIKGPVVALIGDGALTGGMAFEALNDAGHSKLPLIVVLNDNAMSISKNVGALNQYLSEMRASTRYQNFKLAVVRVLDTSAVGKWLSRHMERTKNRIKYFLLPNVMFEDMGFTYLGPIDGHDIKALERVFSRVKNTNRPVIIHAVTTKGKGYSYAEQAPEKYHGIGPFDPATGEPASKSGRMGNSEVFGQALTHLASADPRIVAVCAAMPIGTGLIPFQEAYPDRFFDVGIAEQHAVTMAAGMAAKGYRPVVAIYSTFLQRAFDQVLHDVCLQRLPVVFTVDRAGLIGEDGETHQGVYDIGYLSAMPGLTVYSPATKQELRHMLGLALCQDGPSAIRYPRTPLMEMASAQPVEPGVWEVLEPIGAITILATGRMVETALSIARERHVGLVNVRCIKPLDHSILARLRKEAKGVLTLEDEIVETGFGSRVAAHLTGSGVTVKRLGVMEAPVSQGTVQEQLSWCGLDAPGIERALEALLEEIRS